MKEWFTLDALMFESLNKMSSRVFLSIWTCKIYNYLNFVSCNSHAEMDKENSDFILKSTLESSSSISPMIFIVDEINGDLLRKK